MNVIDYIQKHFSDVSQMPLVSEIRIFGIILKLFRPEDENIEFAKNIFQAPLKGGHKGLPKVICFYKNKKYQRNSS